MKIDIEITTFSTQLILKYWVSISIYNEKESILLILTCLNNIFEKMQFLKMYDLLLDSVNQYVIYLLGYLIEYGLS